MGHPEYLIYAAMALIAFPSAAFNRVALVIVATWTVGHLAVLAGAPFETVNFLQHAVGMMFGMHLARRTACLCAAILFVPLVVVDGLHLLGLLDRHTAWWAVYWMVLAQIVVIPFGNDWGAVRHVWGEYRAQRAKDVFFWRVFG